MASVALGHNAPSQEIGMHSPPFKQLDIYTHESVTTSTSSGIGAGSPRGRGSANSIGGLVGTT